MGPFRGTKCSKVSMSFLEGVVPASNPRRLHLTHWTQALSAAKVSYILGRMSSSVTPLGRAASRGGVLLSSSSVACFFGGDERGLLSSKGCFWLKTGSFIGVEAAWGTSIVRSMSSSSEMMTPATSSGVRIWERLILIALSLVRGPILWGLPFTSVDLGDHPTIAGSAGCAWLSRGPHDPTGPHLP